MKMNLSRELISLLKMKGTVFSCFSLLACRLQNNYSLVSSAEQVVGVERDLNVMTRRDFRTTSTRGWLSVLSCR